MSGTTTRRNLLGIGGLVGGLWIAAKIKSGTETDNPKPSSVVGKVKTPTPRSTAISSRAGSDVQDDLDDTSSYSWPSQDVDCPEIGRDYARWLLDQDPTDPFRLDRDNDGDPCEPYP